MIRVKRMDGPDWGIEVDGVVVEPLFHSLRHASHVTNWLNASGLKVCRPGGCRPDGIVDGQHMLAGPHPADWPGPDDLRVIPERDLDPADEVQALEEDNDGLGDEH